MRKNLLFGFVLSGFVGFAQTNCNYSAGSERTSNGENITTGGGFEYSAATDFDVQARKILTAQKLTFNVLKSSANVSSVNVNILKEFQGMPGEVIHTFSNLTPTSETLDYETNEENLDAYKITVTFPESFNLPKGKYFIQIQAKNADSSPVFWEITKETTSKVGRFDFTKMNTEPWFGGFSYYDHVFEILGNCNDTGESEPDFGTAFTQGNVGNNHETGGTLVARSLADDFIVPDNQKFTFTKFKMSTLQLGNVKSATINIRSSVDDAPGEVLHTFENIGPKTENFYGYHNVQGYPLDVVAADLEFEWNQPVELLPGKYFIEVVATPQPFTDYQRWEATSLPGIGSDSYTSYDGGETWEMNEGYNFVFDVYGFTKAYLAVNDVKNNAISVYPNPVSDVLGIDSAKNIKKVVIYNSVGQIVKTSDKLQDSKLNVSDLSQGAYFVNIVLENAETKTFKVIKK